jgi:CDP-diacylglycerol--serine O-phosphatidyltransferase
MTEDDPEHPAELQRPRRKGIYVLPNSVTLAALFASFYSIVMAMNGKFEAAAIGIFCAAVLDSLDGRIARMTNSQARSASRWTACATWWASVRRRR